MLRALIAGLLVTALAGCSTDEQGDAPYIAARVDGAAWRGSATNGEVAFSVDHPDGNGFVYSIGSRRSAFAEELLALDLPNPPALGDYALGGDTAFATFLTCPTQDIADCTPWPSIAGDPGTLEIVAIDTGTGMIEGNFAFRGHHLGQSAGPVKPVTEGHFRIRSPVAP